jgi:DNA-binding MarR family transcriptional regulator
MDEHATYLLQTTPAAEERCARSLPAPALAAWLQVDLALPQLKVLLVVAHQEPVHVGAVAHRLSISRAHASLLVDHLVRRDLVLRSEDPDDRRRTLVRLTTQGADLLTRLYIGTLA